MIKEVREVGFTVQFLVIFFESLIMSSIVVSAVYLVFLIRGEVSPGFSRILGIALLPGGDDALLRTFQWPIIIIYHVIISAITRGATLAQVVLGIRVIDRHDQPLSRKFAAARALIYLLIYQLAMLQLIRWALTGKPKPFDIFFKYKMVYRRRTIES